MHLATTRNLDRLNCADFGEKNNFAPDFRQTNPETSGPIIF